MPTMGSPTLAGHSRGHSGGKAEAVTFRGVEATAVEQGMGAGGEFYNPLTLPKGKAESTDIASKSS